jgi:hypothetical protein
MQRYFFSFSVLPLAGLKREAGGLKVKRGTVAAVSAVF